MPLTYRIDPDTQMLFVIGEGVITQAERTETMLTWLKDPAFRPSLDTFCDFSAAESTPTTLTRQKNSWVSSGSGNLPSE